MSTTITNMMNPWSDAKILHKKSTSSTMIDARKLVDNGVVSGTVIHADYQSKGEGRFDNRVWLSEKGKNLLATLILDAGALAFPISMLPLTIGLAVSSCIEEVYSVRTLVKWPNDVLANGRKVAGILCESYRSMLLVGVGINCNQRTFPATLANKATSLSLVTGTDIEVTGLLEALLTVVSRLVTEKYPHEALQSRLAFDGEMVKVMIGIPDTDSRSVVEGILEGIDTEGRLVLRNPTTKEVTKILSGEIIEAIR
jgi:BirA family biotin operon repressor/biotin-[acetyl-CoA-carboxylase] ligase